MTKRYHAERILYHSRKWRRKAKCGQPHPFVIGKAMDVAITAFAERKTQLSTELTGTILAFILGKM